MYANGGKMGQSIFTIKVGNRLANGKLTTKLKMLAHVRGSRDFYGMSHAGQPEPVAARPGATLNSTPYHPAIPSILQSPPGNSITISVITHVFAIN